MVHQALAACCQARLMHCCEKPQAMKCGAGPLAPLYYSGQFVPLIVFFLLFLSIVKNNKLHHFVRFHTMQVSALPPPLCTKGSTPQC